MALEAGLPQVDIKPLLSRLWPLPKDSPAPSPDEIADALALFFTNQVSEVQAGSLLMCLHFTGLDRRADVMAACSARMRKAAARIDVEGLKRIVEERGRKEGQYGGGLVSVCVRLGLRVPFVFAWLCSETPAFFPLIRPLILLRELDSNKPLWE